MIRKLLPYLIIILLVMVDVSIVPVFTASVYVLPGTLLFVMCLGMLLGRTHGMLCGLLGGLLIDILAGTPLGYMTFSYIACGYFAGLVGYDTDEMRAQDNYSRAWAIVRRFGVVFGMLVLFEGVTLVYQYFNTALYETAYVRHALSRAAIGAVLSSILYYPVSFALVGKTRVRVHIGTKREVKNL